MKNISRALVASLALVGLLAHGLEGDWRGMAKAGLVLVIAVLSHLRDNIPEETTDGR